MPVIGSVCVVMTLKSVKLSSVVVAREPIVPEIAAAAGMGNVGTWKEPRVGEWVWAGKTRSGATTSSPWLLDEGGEIGCGKPAITAESGAATSPIRTRRRPGRWSSKEVEAECASDCPLLPVWPRECERTDVDGREDPEPLSVCEDAAAEPDGLWEEYGLRWERIECNDPRSDSSISRGWTTMGCNEIP